MRGGSAERGYGGKWRKAAATFRTRHPVCAYCWLDGRGTGAELVDHIYPHGLRRGLATPEAKRLFWRADYWVSCCGVCHRGMKAAVERRGIAAIDELAAQLGLPPLADPDERAACLAALKVASR